MIHHTELLNFIAKKIKARHYLEIGVFNPEHNFNNVNVLFKVGVDPDPNAKASVCLTSDEFFATAMEFGDKYDLIWLDGLHHSDQLRKDIINAWKCLRPGGVIAIHDSNPHSEQITCVPRGKQREWTGDCYRAVCNIQSPKFTVDFDYGCCVLRKPKAHEVGSQQLFLSDHEITWDRFKKEGSVLLNLVSVEQAKHMIESWI